MKNKKNLFFALGATTLLFLSSCSGIAKDEFISKYETAISNRGKVVYETATLSGKIKAGGTEVKYDNQKVYIVSLFGEYQLSNLDWISVGFVNSETLKEFVESSEKQKENGANVTYTNLGYKKSYTEKNVTFESEYKYNDKGMATYIKNKVVADGEETYLEYNIKDYK